MIWSRLWALGICFFCFYAQSAPLLSITAISQTAPTSGETRTQNLPYFVHQSNSGLTRATWTLTLPASLSQAALPALLLPQPVQGAMYKIGDEILYELPGSDAQTLRHWYQPALISLPKSLLKSGQDTTIQVTQSGHLRGWFVAPMLAGELQDLRPLFARYTLISQTLYTTINFLSVIVGVFFLVIALRSKSRAYFYSGMTTLTWSALISIALTSELPAAHFFYWRMALYAAIGWLIYFVSQFTLTIFQHRLPKTVRLGALIFLNLGWVTYGLGGPMFEHGLDVVWIGLAVCIYVLSSVGVIVRALRKRQFARALPISFHWAITSLLAIHDYIVLSGSLPFTLPQTPLPFWAIVVMQPIYLTHIALPVFVFMAMWLLIQDHSQKIQNEIQHISALNDQRERIVNDIHDGVGSRINLLLWSLRTDTPSTEQVESDLQRCMEELRFAINPSQAGHETLHKALSDLCQRLKLQGSAQGIVLDYQRSGEPEPVPSEIGLHLYKATQEALSNALRHSQAKYVQVALTQESGQIQIDVTDDGTGIPNWNNVNQAQDLRNPTSMGIKSVYQRIQSKGGQVHIQSSPNGTIVRMSLMS